MRDGLRVALPFHSSPVAWGHSEENPASGPPSSGPAARVTFLLAGGQAQAAQAVKRMGENKDVAIKLSLYSRDWLGVNYLQVTELHLNV